MSVNSSTSGRIGLAQFNPETLKLAPIGAKLQHVELPQHLESEHYLVKDLWRLSKWCELHEYLHPEYRLDAHGNSQITPVAESTPHQSPDSGSTVESKSVNVHENEKSSQNMIKLTTSGSANGFGPGYGLSTDSNGVTSVRYQQPNISEQQDGAKGREISQATGQLSDLLVRFSNQAYKRGFNVNEQKNLIARSEAIELRILDRDREIKALQAKQRVDKTTLETLQHDADTVDGTTKGIVMQMTSIDAAIRQALKFINGAPQSPKAYPCNSPVADIIQRKTRELSVPSNRSGNSTPDISQSHLTPNSQREAQGMLKKSKLAEMNIVRKYGREAFETAVAARTGAPAKRAYIADVEETLSPSQSSPSTNPNKKLKVGSACQEYKEESYYARKKIKQRNEQWISLGFQRKHGGPRPPGWRAEYIVPEDWRSPNGLPKGWLYSAFFSADILLPSDHPYNDPNVPGGTELSVAELYEYFLGRKNLGDAYESKYRPVLRDWSKADATNNFVIGQPPAESKLFQQVELDRYLKDLKFGLGRTPLPIPFQHASPGMLPALQRTQNFAQATKSKKNSKRPAGYLPAQLTPSRYAVVDLTEAEENGINKTKKSSATPSKSPKNESSMSCNPPRFASPTVSAGNMNAVPDKSNSASAPSHFHNYLQKHPATPTPASRYYASAPPASVHNNSRGWSKFGSLDANKVAEFPAPSQHSPAADAQANAGSVQLQEVENNAAPEQSTSASAALQAPFYFPFNTDFALPADSPYTPGKTIIPIASDNSRFENSHDGYPQLDFSAMDNSQFQFTTSDFATSPYNEEHAAGWYNDSEYATTAEYYLSQHLQNADAAIDEANVETCLDQFGSVNVEPVTEEQAQDEDDSRSEDAATFAEVLRSDVVPVEDAPVEDTSVPAPATADSATQDTAEAATPLEQQPRIDFPDVGNNDGCGDIFEFFDGDTEFSAPVDDPSHAL